MECADISLVAASFGRESDRYPIDAGDAKLDKCWFAVGE